MNVVNYEVGEPMWVHWDDRYVWRGGHILGECPDENLITTVGYLAYMDDKSIILGRGIENHCNEEERKQVIKLFNSGTWYDTFGALKNLYYERTPKGLRMCNLTGEPLQANVLEHIEDIILNIKDRYETFAVIPRGESKLQVYMTISNGTNGAEGCIINPMEDVLNVLKDLRKCKGVTWSQLLEVGIDNADDLYWWYVTFSIDTTAI